MRHQDVVQEIEKQQPSRARSSQHISNYLVFLHFLCKIVLPKGVFVVKSFFMVVEISVKLNWQLLLPLRQTNFWDPKLTQQQNPISCNKLALAHLTSGLTG